MLVQARTGKIGLAKFLHDHRVLGFETAGCRCNAGHETPRHITMFYTDETDHRKRLTDLIGRKWLYLQLIGIEEAVKCFVRWMMCLDRLG